jgi:hypothetical protein
MSGDGEPDPRAWVIYVGDCGHRRVMSSPAHVGPCHACDTSIGTGSLGTGPRYDGSGNASAREQPRCGGHHRTRAGAYPIPDRPPVERNSRLGLASPSR